VGPAAAAASASFFARPGWQVGTGVQLGHHAASCPMSPGPADPNTGAYVYLNGTVKQIGGHQLGRAHLGPVFCAVDQPGPAPSRPRTLGLLGPRIYPLVGTGAFRDITPAITAATPPPSATNMVTGLGSPIMSALLPALTTRRQHHPADHLVHPVAVPRHRRSISGINMDRVTAVDFTAPPQPSPSFLPPSSAAPFRRRHHRPHHARFRQRQQPERDCFRRGPLPTNDNFASATRDQRHRRPGHGEHLLPPRRARRARSRWRLGLVGLAGARQWHLHLQHRRQQLRYDRGRFNRLRRQCAQHHRHNDDYGTSVTSSVTFTATAGTIYHIDVAGYQAANGPSPSPGSRTPALPSSRISPPDRHPRTSVTVTGANFLGVPPPPSAALPRLQRDIGYTDDRRRPTGALTGPIAITGATAPPRSAARISSSSPRSPNDDFANAAVINGVSGEITGNKPAPPASRRARDHRQSRRQIGLVRVDAALRGPRHLHTFGSSFDTLLGVYTGSNVTALTQVAPMTTTATGHQQRHFPRRGGHHLSYRRRWLQRRQRQCRAQLVEG